MLTFVRAGIVAALVLLLPALTAQPAAAEKAFQRDDLADAAIKLEAKIKSDAGQVSKPRGDAAARRGHGLRAQRFPHRPADPRADRGGGAQRQPPTGCGWPNRSCRFARATIRSALALLDRAATAAYIAYQRTGNSAEEAEACW